MGIDYRAYPVLYVDDDAANLVTVRYSLEDQFTVWTASGGEEALALLEARDVAVLLCDQRMPGMSGVEVCARAKDLRPDTIRIMLTAYADMQAAIDAINRGSVSRYLTKPFRDDDLIEVLHTAIELVHIQRTVRDMEVRLLRGGQGHAATTIHAELAHELRNYLGTLVVTTQQIHDCSAAAIESLERLPEQVPPLLETIREASVDSLEAVEQLRGMVARLRRGATQRSSTPPPVSDVARVVDATVRIVRSEVQRVAQLQVIADDSPLVAIDKSVLGQVVMNLVLNAAQAVGEADPRPEDPRVVVRVSREGDAAVLRVTDSGPGVPEGREERIFDPYFTTRESGNGLGLAVVRSLLDAAKGTIKLVPTPGPGACFEVRLPVAELGGAS